VSRHLDYAQSVFVTVPVKTMTAKQDGGEIITAWGVVPKWENAQRRRSGR